MNVHSFIFVFFVEMRPRDADKERAIKESAIEIIVKEGFDGLSMHKLAKAAGVSPATIYIYFKDRDDLIVQLGTEQEELVFEATLEGFDPDMTFDEGMRVQWKNRARYFMDNPKQLYFLEQMKHSPYYKQVSEEKRNAFSAIMAQFVHRAIDNKELALLPIEVFWSLAFAPLYQLVKYHINGKGVKRQPFSLDDQSLEVALSAVLKGLKP